ncbi:uncharacterized protein RCC_02313 [Aspergillus udagawae]|nr:uncharacterized protein RCC_02313 [Aspergillus udagawae]GFG26206.1 uncharacterized protein RCC_02313 [Aspergillus udagawae]
MATSVVSTFAFASLAEGPETAVRLVDVGGGKGHTTQEIQTACSRLKGNAVVLQDLPAVLGNKDDEQPRFQPFADGVPPVAAANLYNQSSPTGWTPAAAGFCEIWRRPTQGFDSRLLIGDLVMGQLASAHPHKAPHDGDMTSYWRKKYSGLSTSGGWTTTLGNSII